MIEKPKQRRGFAAMSPEKRKAISSLGGKAVPAEKRAYSVDKELAASAGVKGGTKLTPEQRTYFKDRELAADAGRKGGKRTAQNKRLQRLKAAGVMA